MAPYCKKACSHLSISIANSFVGDIVRRMVFPRHSGLQLHVHSRPGLLGARKILSRGINNIRAYLGGRISSLITYVTIFCLPMPQAWYLQLSPIHKVEVWRLSLQAACEFGNVNAAWSHGADRACPFQTLCYQYHPSPLLRETYPKRFF